MKDTDWIDVDERLPERIGPRTYLVYRPGGGGYRDHIGVSYWWFESDEWSDGEYIGPHAVTHWMPLPAPPPAPGQTT